MSDRSRRSARLHQDAAAWATKNQFLKQQIGPAPEQIQHSLKLQHMTDSSMMASPQVTTQPPNHQSHRSQQPAPIPPTTSAVSTSTVPISSTAIQLSLSTAATIPRSDPLSKLLSDSDDDGADGDDGYHDSDCGESLDPLFPPNIPNNTTDIPTTATMTTTKLPIFEENILNDEILPLEGDINYDQWYLHKKHIYDVLQNDSLDPDTLVSLLSVYAHNFQNNRTDDLLFKSCNITTIDNMTIPELLAKSHEISTQSAEWSFTMRHALSHFGHSSPHDVTQNVLSFEYNRASLHTDALVPPAFITTPNNTAFFMDHRYALTATSSPIPIQSPQVSAQNVGVTAKRKRSSYQDRPNRR